MEKRGQATVLIILGIVIVILVFSIIQLRAKTVSIERVGDVIVPEQAKGVVQYTEDCLRNLAGESLDLIGKQGGYVELPNEIRYNPRVYLQTVSGLRVPYWVFAESNLRIPTRESIELELENYINNNFLEKCGYEDFVEEGYNFEINNFESEVSINEENVYVRINGNIAADIKGYIFDLDEYVLADVNNKIGKMLDMAGGLIQRELENGPLEFNTMNLIGIYSKQDPRIPPVAGMSLTCGEKSWSKIIATDAVKEVISTYIPCLKVENTDYELCQGQDLYQTMLIDDVFYESYDDVQINFDYLREWPFFMDIYPGKGDTIKMDRLKIDFPLLNPICINFNWFRYDVRYPVLITMEDDYGNQLRFVIEVLIKDNYYRKRMFNLEDKVEPGSLPNFFCDEDQKLGSELSVMTFDAKTGANLEDVDVLYSCNEFRSCLLGRTEIKDENAIFNSKLPLCQGGELSLFKEGYLPYKRRLTSFDEISLKTAELEPFRKRLAKVVVLERDGSYITRERELIEGESVYLQLDRLNDEIDTYDWQDVYNFDSDELREIMLVPGAYDLSVNLNWEEEVLLDDLGEEVSGVTLGGANFVWNVYELDLDKNTIVTFYVVSNGMPRTMGDVEANLNYDEIFAKFEDRLIPEFS